MISDESHGDFRKVVVDTGPLFNVLVLVFLRSFPTHQRYNQQRLRLPTYLINNPTRQRELLELFNSIKVILITSHVIGELPGLLKGTKLPAEDFWLSSMEYLSRKRVDERLLRLVELYEDENMSAVVCKTGSTDAGLIKLAIREKCMLLTEDNSTLARHAWQLGFGDNCKLLRNLLQI